MSADMGGDLLEVDKLCYLEDTISADRGVEKRLWLGLEVELLPTLSSRCFSLHIKG